MPEVGRYLSNLLMNRRISTAELAKRLGYKSTTSVARVMQGRANRESVEKFARRLMENEQIALTEGEACELRKAVDSTFMDDDTYAAEREMWAFLRGDHSDMSAEVVLEDVEDGVRHELADRYVNASEIQITLLNCQYEPVFQALKVLTSRTDVKIEHFLYVDSSAARTIRAVNRLLTVFYERQYMGHVLMPDGSNPQYPLGMLGADAMVCAYADADGTRREDLVVFDGQTHGWVARRTGAEFAFLRLLGIQRERFSPFKRTYFSCSALDDYIQYSADYTALELNRAVYKVKPDIGIDYISVDILAAAMREGPIPMNAHLGDVLNKLYIIYDKRNRDAFTKKKSAHTILKQRAMWKFVKTGRTSDHFWGMRPFTLEERAQILIGILEQQRSNPYFHLHFLRDDDSVRDAEITCYEDIGILMLEANTDYDLSEGHSEAMFTHREFMRLFKEFLLKRLTLRHTLPAREGEALLERMIQYCENPEENFKKV